MTVGQFRRIALGHSGASEGAHMDHPDFRVGGRIFATVRPADGVAMVKLTPEQQAAMVAAHPAIFEPESGAWGRQGSTRVRLVAADADAVGEAVTLAWRNQASRAPAKARPAAKSAGGTTRARAAAGTGTTRHTRRRRT